MASANPLGSAVSLSLVTVAGVRAVDEERARAAAVRRVRHSRRDSGDRF
jgi:hypothetical protein